MIFGEQSLKCLESVHIDLVLIHITAIKTILVDYGIHCGARTFDEQLNAFLNKTSQLDPRKPEQLKKSMHVLTKERPSAMATDIHISETFNDKSLEWNNIHLTYVMGYLFAIADNLYKEGKISHKVRWGGNWDNDGIIQLDQNFNDNCHIELI